MKITKLPDTAFDIIKLLTIHDLLSTSEIQESLNISKRRMKYAIRRLAENDIIHQVPNLMDMRSVKYKLADSTEMDEVYDHLTNNLYDKVQSVIQHPYENPITVEN